MRLAVLAVLLACVPLVAGCDPAQAAERAGNSESAQEAPRPSSAFVTTAADVPLRSSPSSLSAVVKKLARGAALTALSNTPERGYFEVSHGGDRGFVYGAYVSGAPNGPRTPSPIDPAPSRDEGNATLGTAENCEASFYTTAEGTQTASGEPLDDTALTAAHKTLKFGTRVKVTSQSDPAKSVIVRITDRGPFVAGRCIDLSRAAFAEIAPLSRGVTDVSVQVIGGS